MLTTNKKKKCAYYEHIEKSNILFHKLLVMYNKIYQINASISIITILCTLKCAANSYKILVKKTF